MIANLIYALQLNAIITFSLLTILSIFIKDWNFGVGVNAALVLLYIFLYLQPIK